MHGAITDLVKNTLLVFGALLPIVNPFGSAPIFLTMTRGISGPARGVLARMIAFNGLVLILASIFTGTYILKFFGISLPVVQVGGGLVVVATAWTLLSKPDDEDRGSGAERPCREADYTRQAFYPLTLPLTVGPGSISVAITVGANRKEGSEWAWPLIAGMLLGSGLMALAIYIAYRFADRLAHVLGDAAMNVVVRLSSFILVCIGVQIFWNGLSTLLKTVVR